MSSSSFEWCREGVVACFTFRITGVLGDEPDPVSFGAGLGNEKDVVPEGVVARLIDPRMFLN